MSARVGRAFPALALLAVATGCQTAAVFDVGGQEVLGFGVVGFQSACKGDGQRLAIALTDRTGGVVKIGSSRIPTLPDSARTALTFLDATLDGTPVTVTAASVHAATAPDAQTYAVVLDRSGSACGALPVGPWAERCNLEPCRDSGAGTGDCTVEHGCCASGKTCVGLIGHGGAGLTQQCVVPSNDCDTACGADAICDKGDCVLRLHGAIDPEDRWVQAAAGTAARLLNRDPEALVPPVSVAWALASSGAGLQALTAAPTADFQAIERSFERELLAPYGAPALMDNLGRLDTDGPVIVWAMNAGPGTLPAGRGAHLFAALDAGSLTEADDAAFAGAACATDGAYIRLPADADVDTLSGSLLPAAARSRVVYDVTLDPPPDGGGPHRFSGTVRLDVGAVVGDGSKPPVATIDQPFDLILGGAP